MDSPPECVLALSCEPPVSPSMPSLDHSPLAAAEPSLQSSATPSPQSPTDGSLSPFPGLLNHQLDSTTAAIVNGEALEDELEGLHEELEEEEEEAMSAPPSPTPAVALFPGEGAGVVSGPPPPRESPPGSPPSVPSVAGFVALEMALSASSTTTAGAQCGEDDGELDLQLFHRDATITSAPSVTTGGAAAAALRFPCNVCGKRFRFQSILSLHARAHRLDRQRRATVLYHAGRDACKPPQHAPLDQLQERSPMTNQECSTDQSTLKNLETNLERSQDGRSPDACLENNPERRRNRRKRTMDRRPEPRLDQRVDLNFGTSPAGSLESSPREVIHHEDSHQNTFSPHFMSDPFQSPSLTPPPTKEAPIMAAFTPLLPSHFEDAAQTVDVSAAAGVTAAASSFRCNECKGKFRTASELARHTRILHNPYKCTMCPFSASQEERLATHLRDSHPAPSVTAPHEHQVAPSTAKSTTSLPFSPQRTRENPTPPELPVTITALNASANASVNASAASSQVSGGAPLPAFRCETCGQRFTQSWFLKGHMRKHKDSLDHKCQVCGRGFKEPWFLKNHMKVHLNKLGLKAGLAGLGLSPVPGGGELTGKSSGGAGGSRGKNQSLSALYSSLLLARTGAGGAGGAGAGVFGGGVGGGAGSRAERELATAVAAATAAAAAAATGSASGSSKASILSYLGLPGAEGASCVERLQAVAQVAEMGNGERRERERDRDRERTREERPEATHGGGGGGGSDAADQAAMWQLVARSLAAAQHSHHQQQQQQQQQQQKARSRPHQPHQPLSQPRGSVAGEAEQLRAYLGGLGGPGTGSSGGGGRERDDHHLVTASSGSSGMGGSEASLGGPWECPDCGKLFRSLQQVVAHARVHLQKPHKGHQRDEESLLRGGGGGGGGEGGARRGGSNSSSGGGGVTNSSSESRTEPKLSKTRTGMAGGFHSLLAPFSGENGLRGVAAGSSLAPRERVRGKGMKDCPYCGKAFRSSHHLKVHLRVHTGERPYKCPHCDYAGTQSGSLKYHLQRHHREQQRNALASSSPGLPTLPLPPRSNESSNVPKQRLAQSLAQLGVFGRTGVATTTPTDSQTVTSRHSQAWARANQEEKSPKGSATSDAAAAAAAAALKEGDLERQYHFLSGVMGALYQGRLPEASWLGELGGQGPPPAKQPKVSRRKPLTTSRMVPTNGHGGGGGRVPSSLSPSPPLHGRTQEGGFEPLDLSSRRTLPEMDGGERRRKREASGGERRQGAEGGGRGGGGGGGGGAGAVTLTQCLFCPFRTSSAELMAMHLQVNHTSKSRRKRSSPLPLPAAAPATSPAPPSTTSSVPATTTAPEPDQLALWRYISGQDEVPSVPTFQDDQTLFVTRAPPRENGLGLEDEEEEDELEQDEEEELLQHEIDEDGDLASDTYEPSVSSTLHEKEEEEIGEGMGEMDEEEEEEEEEDEDERKKKNMKSGRMERLEALHAVLSGRSPGGRGAASPRIEEGTVGD